MRQQRIDEIIAEKAARRAALQRAEDERLAEGAMVKAEEECARQERSASSDWVVK